VISTRSSSHRATVAAARSHEANVNSAFAQNLSFNDRLALVATRVFGSMPTFYLFVVWALLPIVPFLRHAEPIILYVSAGFIQLVALPLISVGQNLLGRHSEARAEADYAVNQKAFADTERLLKQQQEMLAQMKVLDERTLQLVQQIAGGKGQPEKAG